MGWAIKGILGLAVTFAVVLVAYGYSVDMAPSPQESRIDVVLDAR
jgi:hypothetical protein